MKVPSFGHPSKQQVNEQKSTLRVVGLIPMGSCMLKDEKQNPRDTESPNSEPLHTPLQNVAQNGVIGGERTL